VSRAVVLDTNILVSAALKPGSDIARILERVLLRQAPMYVCPSIVAEYQEVLNRPKLRPNRLLKNDASPPGRDGQVRDKDAGSARSSATGATEDAVSRRPVRSGGRGFDLQQPPKGLPPGWLPRLLQIAFHEPEPAPWPLEGPDPDDLVFLALAKASGAVLVTGNQAHFPAEIRDGVRVMSPLEYLGQMG
jgi:predicted nucleic acid-binding protein